MFYDANSEKNSNLFSQIQKLKEEKNAIILAHYYQDSNIQDIADYLGDSLGLARKAAETNAKVIIFAGVHFMAETAKILNPDKLVLLPDVEAGCSLADSCPPETFLKFKKEHPNHLIISYINCSAAIKAMSDIICTSANAVDIIKKIPTDQSILFAPDQNLGRYIMRETGRDLLLWPGSCVVHETFSEKKILQLRTEYPQAQIIAHPECEPSILQYADYIGSTTALLKYIQKNTCKTFIVATETGILHQMRKSCPDKLFLSAPTLSGCSCNECPHMRLNTLEKLYTSIKNASPQITLTETVVKKAINPIERMLALSS
uniref:Quinolinate synthase n=1 Tax=Glaucocystis sp. BBH TaxID=2023628 RepID=A0A3G1IUX1_9EUKA|nr:Quinolinate synthetase complex subunit A [Glaucocystis sp. BBH]